jgi:tetratricopeptide (TPR) repeat protein
MDLGAVSILKKANECYKRQDYAKALVLYSEIVDSASPNKDVETQVEAFFHMANIFHMKGDIGKAIKAFSKVVELDPNHTDASISLSVLYNDIGKYENAKKIFKETHERVRDHSLGTTLEDEHINKKFSVKHYELAELYVSYNRYDEALFEYNKAINLDSENLEARIKLAKTYSKKGFTSKAIEELKRLKNEEPSYFPARIALGVVYYGQGKTLEAQTEWEQVLSRDPAHSDAMMYLNLSRSASETTL